MIRGFYPIKKKHFCKLDKNLRNFSSWQFFVFETVFKIFGFEIRDFKQWSCDILENYCPCVFLNNTVVGNILSWEFKIYWNKGPDYKEKIKASRKVIIKIL